MDALLADPYLPAVPMVRFVDPDLTGRMTEYVALHVLYHHRRMSEFARAASAQGVEVPARAGRARGARRADGARRAGLGRGCRAQGVRLPAARLEPLAQDARGRRLLRRGGELDAFLADTDILAVLLPLTPDTRGILNRRAVRQAVAPGPR